jgi:hypothetical protein
MKIIKKTGDVYIFLKEIKEGDKVFSFTDPKTTPFGQIAEIQYCEDNPTQWVAKYGDKLYPIHNIQKWIWEHQKSINNKTREIKKGA